MLETLGLLIVGLIVGCYGTLVGIGGGPLIVPVIASVYGYDTPTVISTSLFVIFFNTLSGSIAYIKDRKVDFVSGTKFGLATIPGSLMSTFAVYYVNLHLFVFLFGIFLIAMAAYILFKPLESDLVQIAAAAAGGDGPEGRMRSSHIPGSRYPSLWRGKDSPSEEWGRIKGDHMTDRVIKDARGNLYRYRVNEPRGMMLTALIGVFSTFLGIGGGLMQVPVLVFLLSFPVHVATATSHYITVINTCFTLIPFMVYHDIAYGPASTLALGSVLGAQIGARISNKVSGKTLLKLLIPIFLFMAMKLLLFT